MFICSFFCLEQLPTSCPTFLQRATLSCSSGLISELLLLGGLSGDQGTGMLDAYPLIHIGVFNHNNSRQWFASSSEPQYSIAWAPLFNRFGVLPGIYLTSSFRWLWCISNFKNQCFCSKLIRIEDNEYRNNSKVQKMLTLDDNLSYNL